MRDTKNRKMPIYGTLTTPRPTANSSDKLMHDAHTLAHTSVYIYTTEAYFSYQSPSHGDRALFESSFFSSKSKLTLNMEYSVEQYEKLHHVFINSAKQLSLINISKEAQLVCLEFPTCVPTLLNVPPGHSRVCLCIDRNFRAPHVPIDIKLHECYLQATSSSQKFSILPTHHTPCVLHVQISVQTEVNNLLTLARSVVLANCKPVNSLEEHLQGELPSSEVKTLIQPFTQLTVEIQSSLFSFLLCSCRNLQHCCIQQNCKLGTSVLKIQSIWDTILNLNIA